MIELEHENFYIYNFFNVILILYYFNKAGNLFK